MFSHLTNYQPADPTLWQGRKDTIGAERYFERITFLNLPNSRGLTAGSRIALPSLDPEDKATDILFLGFASDTGIIRNLGRPGAHLGPDAIRTHLAKLPCHNNKTFVDLGTVCCDTSDLETAQDQLAEIIGFCHQQGKKTIVLGGGHEVAWAHYQGLVPHYSRLGIINFDAHFDLRPHQKGDEGTSGTPFMQIANYCQEHQKPFDYCCIGLQKSGNTPSLIQQADALHVKYLFANTLLEKNQAWQRAFLDDFIKDVSHIYLTICLDVFAECFAPGVSAPQAAGLAPWHIMPLLKHIIRSNKVVSFDIAELSPPLDEGKKTARLAALIVAELLDIF